MFTDTVSCSCLIIVLNLLGMLNAILKITKRLSTRKYTNKRLSISICTEGQNWFWLLLLEETEDKKCEWNQRKIKRGHSYMYSLISTNKKMMRYNVSLVKNRLQNWISLCMHCEKIRLWADIYYIKFSKLKSNFK